MDDRLVVFQYLDDSVQRLDRFLVDCLPELSRSRIQGLIREGRVSVNGSVTQKAGLWLEGAAEVTIEIPAPRPAGLKPEPIPLDVIYEDKNVLLINKPAGVVVHPAAGHVTGTLVHAALAHAPEMEGISGEQRPGVVHRLDKDTSGLIVLAKNDAAHRWLIDQFRDRKAHKIYYALVDGHPPTPTGRIETPIGRSPVDRKKMAVVVPGKGRQAITEYRLLEKFTAHALLEVHPITGRTHQIRIHLNFLGCPVVGDTLYGRRHPSLPVERQFLHAARLTIMLPGEVSPRTFEAPLPADLAGVLKNLR
jgi:23S rRNA pseudouridine1911/1915/1917 synthase